MFRVQSHKLSGVVRRQIVIDLEFSFAVVPDSMKPDNLEYRLCAVVVYFPADKVERNCLKLPPDFRVIEVVALEVA